MIDVEELYENAEKKNKLKSLLKGLELEGPEYWESRSAKDLHDLGRCISNGISTKLDYQLLIDALIECSDRLRMKRSNGMPTTLDNCAVELADKALASVGVMKNEK
jgi:hypothetical protein